VFDSIRSDPRFISAVVSAAIALLIGLLTIWVNLWKIRREFKQAEAKLSEELTALLVKQRIESYEKLMTDLKQISSLYTRGKDGKDLKEKVEKIITAIQDKVFGRFGLIATHETRETVLRLRSKCVQFVNGKTQFDEVRKASWVVHQMLRSDLGLSQPNLESAIDRLRTGELAGKKEQIERLIADIHHNIWDSQ
jgi:hypothetical protein